MPNNPVGVGNENGSTSDSAYLYGGTYELTAFDIGYAPEGFNWTGADVPFTPPDVQDRLFIPVPFEDTTTGGSGGNPGTFAYPSELAIAEM